MNLDLVISSPFVSQSNTRHFQREFRSQPTFALFPSKLPAGTNMYLQGLGNIFFATNMQHSHCMVNTLHKIMNNQATDGDMSKATTKIKPILIKLNFVQVTW